LIGRSPFHTIDRAETLRRARTNEYEPPRRINPNVPVELNAIVAKALAMEPHDRFDNALELADELERWMVGEPVQSYPEPLLRRVARFTKQHQPYVISSILLLAMLSLGLVFLNQAISKERDNAELSRKRAEQSSKTSAGIIDEFVKNLADNTWSQIPGMDEKRLAMLDIAHDRLTDELKVTPDDVELQRRWISIIMRLAAANRTLGRLDRASELYSMIMPLIDKGKPSELSEDDMATFTDALAIYSSILNATQGPTAALRKNQRNLELSQERFRREPATHTQIGLTRAWIERANLLIDIADTSDARRTLEQATSTLKSVFNDTFRNQIPHAFDLYAFQIEWGLLQCDMLDEAWNAAYERLPVVASKIESMRQHAALARDSVTFEGRIQYFKARILRKLERLDDAMAAIEDSIAKLEQHDGNFPSQSTKRGLVEAIVEKGLIRVQKKDIELAQSLLKKAEERVAGLSDKSSAMQLLPLEIQIAKLDLKIAEASDEAISPTAAQQRLDAAKEKLKAIEPKSVWLR
jgi:tetratricopeptide (TPR) repeat protein